MPKIFSPREKERGRDVVSGKSSYYVIIRLVV